MAKVILTAGEERGDFIIVSTGEYDVMDLVTIYYKSDPQRIEYQFQAGFIVYGSEFWTTITSETLHTPTDSWRTVISEEFAHDPLSIGYANMSMPDKHAAISTPNRPLANRFITIRTLISDIGPILTATIYTKLSAAAQQNIVLEMGLDMLKTYSEGGGINICDSVVIAMIREMGDSVLTREEADALEALAYTSRAKELIGRDLTLEELESL